MKSIRNSILARSLVGVAGAVLIVALSACASPTSIKPGMRDNDALQRLGKPQAVYTRPSNAGQRMEYPFGPHNQTVWMIDIDAAGVVTRVQQVHSTEVFDKLQTGTDTMDSVRRTLGTPWQIERYALSGLTGWLYPYREDRLWNSVMTMMFDVRGVLVRRENGPDPRFLGGPGNKDD